MKGLISKTAKSFLRIVSAFDTLIDLLKFVIYKNVLNLDLVGLVYIRITRKNNMMIKKPVLINSIKRLLFIKGIKIPNLIPSPDSGVLREGGRCRGWVAMDSTVVVIYFETSQ